MVDRSINEQATADSSENHSSRTLSSEANYSYGREMWDCIQIFNDNTQHRTQFMRSLKSFYTSYKKGLDNFSSALIKANAQFEKDFVKVKGDHIVDTLSTAMVNMKMCFDEIIKGVLDKSEMVQKDLVEPLEIYYKHYYSQNTELIKQATYFWNNLHSERTSMLFAKESYYNNMNSLSQLQQQFLEPALNALNIQQVDTKTKQQIIDESPYLAAQDKKIQIQSVKAENSRSDYERYLIKMNGTIDQFDTAYRPTLNRIQESDDSQINYIKHSLEKFSRYIDNMGREITKSSEDIVQTISMISSETDIKIFIDKNRTQNPFLQKEDYQPYEVRSNSYSGKQSADLNISFEQTTPTKHKDHASKSQASTPRARSNDDDDYLLLSSSSTFDKDREKIIDKMQRLLRSEPIKIEEKSEVIQYMNQKELRLVITEVLNDITSPKLIHNNDCLKILSDILKYILSLFVHERCNDYKLLYTILESSQNIYCLNNKRKQFLSSLLADHQIWLEVRTWNNCIYEIIQLKIDEASARKKKRQSEGAQAEQQKEKGFFKKGFKTIKGILSNKDKVDQQQQELKANQNLIFNELSRFVQYFINFGLSFEQSNEILINYCNQYQLEQSRIHLLLTELQSNQKKTSSMFTEKEQLIWSLQRRGNRLKAFGFSDQMQIMGMTIKFIDSDVTLKNILLLCKDFNDLLKPEILKQSLLRASQERLKQKRTLLWLDILQIDLNYVDVEYESCRQRSILELPKNISDAIEVDVNRSFNNLKKITSDNLNNILKTYAVVNKSLDYCQGMNFIAGYLYLLFEKESLAYAVMKEIINKFKMSELFNAELPMLKLNFYQLDRLISIILPDLHTHFKDETINSSYYSAPYFITLFTSSLQMSTTGEHCEKMLRLWDYFIINGWKSIFKGSLILLKEFEEHLLNMPFEVMLTQTPSLPIKFYVHQYDTEEDERDAISKFDRQMKALKIPTMLLERLKKEFDENYKLSVRTSNVNESNFKQLR